MKTVSLRDGSQVTLRPLRPDDESALTALYERLSPQASYQRFLHGDAATPARLGAYPGDH
jgi:hypothetical protein